MKESCEGGKVGTESFSMLTSRRDVSENGVEVVSAHEATASARRGARRALAGGEVGGEGAGAGDGLVGDDWVVPPLWCTLRQDVEMRAEAILICGLRAPLRVAVCGTQVRDHDCDGLAGTGAVALACGCDVADVGQFVAGAATASTPAAGTAEEVLRACCREYGGAVAGLPGGH
jgi:hypothetical protein